MKQIITVLAAMAMIFAFPIVSYAESVETATHEQEASVVDEIYETAYVFETEDGQVCFELPADGDDWTIIDDPASWFAISDGKDLITVDFLSYDNPAPDVEIGDEWYQEVYQENYDTNSATFVITGYVTNQEDTDAIIESVSSFMVLLNQDEPDDDGTVLDADENGSDDEEDDWDATEVDFDIKGDDSDTAENDADNAEDDSEYDLNELDIAGYCTQEDGVYVWDGPSTDSTIIGSLDYDEQVLVYGVVLADEAYTGWLCVDFDDRTGYIWGDFLSSLDPEEDFDLASLAYAEDDDPDGDARDQVPFVLFNDGWYVAKLWVEFLDGNKTYYNYYTGSVIIGDFKTIWLDIPDDPEYCWVTLMMYEFGWEDTHLCDLYQNLDDPNVAEVCCFSTGTTFKPKFKSHEEFSKL